MREHAVCIVCLHDHANEKAQKRNNKVFAKHQGWGNTLLAPLEGKAAAFPYFRYKIVGLAVLHMANVNNAACNCLQPSIAHCFIGIHIGLHIGLVRVQYKHSQNRDGPDKEMAVCMCACNECYGSVRTTNGFQSSLAHCLVGLYAGLEHMCSNVCGAVHACEHACRDAILSADCQRCRFSCEHVTAVQRVQGNLACEHARRDASASANCHGCSIDRAALKRWHVCWT